MKQHLSGFLSILGIDRLSCKTSSETVVTNETNRIVSIDTLKNSHLKDDLVNRYSLKIINSKGNYRLSRRG